ncbi:hypothetical protein B0J17DRAFT_674286 [Rhizoctonia solani]|nr:hypothetical protein B0J17DRAFT_674286 [Rhizoctonia solani]
MHYCVIRLTHCYYSADDVIPAADVVTRSSPNSSSRMAAFFFVGAAAYVNGYVPVLLPALLFLGSGGRFWVGVGWGGVYWSALEFALRLTLWRETRFRLLLVCRG